MVNADHRRTILRTSDRVRSIVTLDVHCTVSITSTKPLIRKDHIISIGTQIMSYIHSNYRQINSRRCSDQRRQFNDPLHQYHNLRRHNRRANMLKMPTDLFWLNRNIILQMYDIGNLMRRRRRPQMTTQILCGHCQNKKNCDIYIY